MPEPRACNAIVRWTNGKVGEHRMRIFRITRTLILVTFVTMSLALNVATVAFSSIAMLVSGAYEAVTGATSVTGVLRRDVDTKSKKIASMSDDLKLKNKRIGSLTDELATFKQSKTVSYRGQRRLIGEAVEDTTARLSRRTATAATRSAGSVVAEAIPFAGIAVIVGVTAWELKDSCATMNDLHQLNVAFNPDAARDPEVTEVCGLEVPSKDKVWQSVKSSPGKAWETAKAHVPDLPEWQRPELVECH